MRRGVIGHILHKSEISGPHKDRNPEQTADPDLREMVLDFEAFFLERFSCQINAASEAKIKEIYPAPSRIPRSSAAGMNGLKESSCGVKYSVGRCWIYLGIKGDAHDWLNCFNSKIQRVGVEPNSKNQELLGRAKFYVRVLNKLSNLEFDNAEFSFIKSKLKKYFQALIQRDEGILKDE
jgi:hypothetical protein